MLKLPTAKLLNGVANVLFETQCEYVKSTKP